MRRQVEQRTRRERAGSGGSATIASIAAACSQRTNRDAQSRIRLGHQARAENGLIAYEDRLSEVAAKYRRPSAKDTEAKASPREVGLATSHSDGLSWQRGQAQVQSVGGQRAIAGRKVHPPRANTDV